jgi:hypothetical protein
MGVILSEAPYRTVQGFAQNDSFEEFFRSLLDLNDGAALGFGSVNLMKNRRPQPRRSAQRLLIKRRVSHFRNSAAFRSFALINM